MRKGYTLRACAATDRQCSRAGAVERSFAARCAWRAQGAHRQGTETRDHFKFTSYAFWGLSWCAQGAVQDGGRSSTLDADDDACRAQKQSCAWRIHTHGSSSRGGGLRRWIVNAGPLALCSGLALCAHSRVNRTRAQARNRIVQQNKSYSVRVLGTFRVRAGRHVQRCRRHRERGRCAPSNGAWGAWTSPLAHRNTTRIAAVVCSGNAGPGARMGRQQTDVLPRPHERALAHRRTVRSDHDRKTTSKRTWC